jgi:hypothetical protein
VIAVVVAFALAAADPVGLVAGEPAPFDGVLIDVDRAGELVVIEAEATALRRQLEEQRKITDAWKQAATVEWHEAPELHRWIGFGAGVVVTVGAMVLGAWAVDVAAARPSFE